MRAADTLMESLKAEGVKHVFGIPGGANLPIYDAVVDADLIANLSDALGEGHQRLKNLAK